MNILPQLLTPLPIDHFLAEYWTKKAIHIVAEHSDKFQHLFSWNDFNDLLNYHRLAEPDLRFSKQGKLLPETVDRQTWSDRIRQGATLILDGVHHRVPAVAWLTAHLSQDLSCETHVNLYCSPTQQQGFDCHYDTHDVLILQIEGNKEWFVYPETVPSPTARMDSAQYEPPTGDPYIHCILQPGDLLYIPRGHWHYAIACNQPSLHLTVGIESQTGLDWLSWLVSQLQQQPLWRQTLPIATATQAIQANATNHPTEILDNHLNTLRHHLIEILQQPHSAQQYIAAMSDRHQPSLLVNLPEQIGVDLFPQGLMTCYSWSPLHRIWIQQKDTEHYHIHIGSKQFDLKGIPAALVDHLFAQKEFSLLKLADWAPDLDLEADVIPLISRFVESGALQVKRNQNREEPHGST